MKADYGDVVPRRDHTMLEEKFEEMKKNRRDAYPCMTTYEDFIIFTIPYVFFSIMHGVMAITLVCKFLEYLVPGEKNSDNKNEVQIVLEEVD